MENGCSLPLFISWLSLMATEAREIHISALTQGEHFSSCLVHILVQDFVKFPLDYISFSNPVVVDVAVPFYNLTLEIHDLETAYYARFIKVHDSSDYLRNLNCILTLVLVNQIPGSLASMHYVPFLQRFIFAHNSDSDVVLPGYFVIISQNTPFGSEDEVRAELEGFAMKASKTYFHPIFWLPLENGHSSSVPGWLYCSFCRPSRAFTHFNYTDWSDCVDSMMRVYELATDAGRGVEWRLLVDQVHHVPVFIKLPPCPFTMRNDHSCVQDEFELFVQFLFEGLNEAEFTINETIRKSDVAYPVVVRKGTNMDGMPVGFIEAGQRYEFRFLTCHGVAETSMSLHALISPLSNKVWFALAVTMVATAFTFAGLREGGKLLMKVLRNIHWMWVMCLDQPATNKILQGVYSKTASALILGSWLLLLVFIVNAYKAMVKCIYVLEPTYTTPLRYLRDLEGFKLFFLYTPPGREANYMRDEDRQSQILYCEKLRILYPQWAHSNSFDCEAEFYGLMCSNPAFHGHGTSVCKAMNWFKQRLCTTPNGDERQWLRRYCKLLRGLLRHVRIRLSGQLDELIKTELSKPKTAIVVPQEEFESIWKQAKAIMVSNKLKLASNRHTDFDYLLSVEPYYKISAGFVTTGVNKNVLMFRATVLVESGVSGQWKNWKKFRQSWMTESSVMQLPNFMPLSLFNSNVAVVFHLYFYCTSFTIGTLLVELAVGKFNTHAKKLNHLDRQLSI